MANVGNTDRIIRIVIGLALFGLFAMPAPVKYFGVLGFVAIGTAAIGFCPLYKLIGVKTNKS